MNIGEVNWRNDAITRYFIATHQDLSNPSKMTDFNLAIAATYCLTCENPYAEEICRRADMEDKYARAATCEEKNLVVCAAAYELGMRIC